MSEGLRVDGALDRSYVGALEPGSKMTLETGAGEGNRTLVVSLGSFCSTIELHPRGLDFTIVPGPDSTGGQIYTLRGHNLRFCATYGGRGAALPIACSGVALRRDRRLASHPAKLAQKRKL